MSKKALAWGLVVLPAALLAVSPLLQAQVKIDPKLAAYEKTDGVAGSIKSVGSDTMNNEMTLWAEGFLNFYPSVQMEIEGKGSTTGPPALIAGTSTFCPMSRPMKAKEIDDFESKFGYKPTGLRTSIDMLAVFVHKDNPIKGLTLQQVDAIFSKTRKAGYDKDIRTWGDLGLTGEWADKRISLFGRNSSSGTYGYFKEHVLQDGDYKNEVKEQPGSSSVVQGVAKDKYAIGYCGIGYRTADVRPVPLAKEPDGEFVPVEPDRAYAGDYPLARYLLVYVNYKPGSQLDPLRRQFVKYLFSKEGQLDVVKSGYLPIGAVIARKELKLVGMD
jgi:phosphate transport system substrate-binding protein